MGFEPETTTDRSARMNRRRQRKQPLVQTLFETCAEVFANGGTGFVPPPADIQRLCSILDSMKAADVGLSPEMPYFRATKTGQAPVITYLHLYECEQFSMGIFCLPPSGVLPLHNHPGMTVFSKILCGTMHIKSYDWANDITCSSPTGAAGPRLAKLQVNAAFAAPCGTSVLYPTAGGNMHCFTAVTSCAVLDVLGPPYSDRDGRHCTYYLERPLGSFSVDGVAADEKESFTWLQERDKPSDLFVVGAPYRGPKITDWIFVFMLVAGSCTSFGFLGSYSSGKKCQQKLL